MRNESKFRDSGQQTSSTGNTISLEFRQNLRGGGRGLMITFLENKSNFGRHPDGNTVIKVKVESSLKWITIIFSDVEE